MTIRIQITAALLLLILTTSPARAQWKQLNVGEPGEVKALAVVGNNLLAGTLAGIYLSTNQGASWSIVNNHDVQTFAVRDSEVFGGGLHGVVRSTDEGRTWTVPDPQMNYEIFGLAVHDSDIYAGGKLCMLRSTDGGASWTTIENGLSYYQTLVEGLTTEGTKVLAATDAGVCVSTDGGDDWTTLVSTGASDDVTNTVFLRDSTALVGWPGGIIRSTDNGSTWSFSSPGSGAPTFCFASFGNLIFAGEEDGVHVSTDDGASWTTADSGLPGNQAWCLAANDSGVFAGTNDRGVFRSTDSGVYWTPATSGIITSEVNSLAGTGSDVYAAMDYKSVVSSTDYGRTWTSDTSLHAGASSLTVIGNEVYAVSNGGIYASSNNGESWSPKNGGTMDTEYPSILLSSGTNLVAACQDSGHIYLSSDGGTTWSNVGQNVPEIASMTTSGPDIVAGTHDGIYASTDEGATWKEVNGSLININAIESSGSYIFAGRYDWPIPIGFAPPSPPGGVFRSSDGGMNWAADSSGIPSAPPDVALGPQIYSLAVQGEDVYAGASPGVYAATIHGNEWSDVGGNLPESTVLSLYANDSTVYAGMERGGIWAAPIDEVTGIVSPVRPHAPSSFKLAQNYPNPFNPSTTIDFKVPRLSHVKLVVYDVLGRKVETLVDTEMGPGEYSIQFDASNLASGVYFYRLMADNFLETKKLMLIK